LPGDRSVEGAHPQISAFSKLDLFSNADGGLVKLDFDVERRGADGLPHTGNLADPRIPSLIWLSPAANAERRDPAAPIKINALEHFFDAHQIKNRPERITCKHEFKTSFAWQK
jgi:hypothetical protein